MFQPIGLRYVPDTLHRSNRRRLILFQAAGEAACDENCPQNVRPKTFPGVALLYETADRWTRYDHDPRRCARGGNPIRRMATREGPI
jgi:hypothetical protein